MKEKILTLIKNKKIMTIALAVAVLVIGAVIFTAVFFSRPKTIAKLTIADTLSELRSREEVEFLTEVLRQGSIEATVEGKGAQAHGKLYFSQEKVCVYAEDVYISSGSQNWKASGYVGLDDIWVSADGWFNGTYGLTKGEAEKSISQSDVLTDMRKNEYDSEIYYMVQALCHAYDMENTKELLEALQTESEKYNEKMLDLVMKYAEMNMDKKTVKVAGERVEGRVIEVTIDSDAMENIREDLLTYLENSRSVRKLLEKYEYFFVSLAGKNPDINDIDEIFEEYLEEQEDAIENAKDVTYTVQLITKPHSNTLLLASLIKKSDEGKEEIFSVDLGAQGLKKGDTISLSSRGNKILEYKIKENSSKAYETKITLYSTMEFSFKHDKKKDSFKMNFSSGDKEIVSAKGDCTYEDGVLALGVEEVALFGEDMLDCAVEFVIRTNDEIQSVNTPHYKNIMYLTEQDLDDFADDWEDEKYDSFIAMVSNFFTEKIVDEYFDW